MPSGIFPSGKTKYFVTDTSVAVDSYISVTFRGSTGEQVGAGTVRYIEKQVGVGFTIYLTSVCFNNVPFDYEVESGVAPGAPTLQSVSTAGATTSNILSYTTHPTFTSNTQIVDKQYVDNATPAGVWSRDDTNQFVYTTTSGDDVMVGDNSVVWLDTARLSGLSYSPYAGYGALFSESSFFVYTNNKIPNSGSTGGLTMYTGNGSANTQSGQFMLYTGTSGVTNTGFIQINTGNAGSLSGYLSGTSGTIEMYTGRGFNSGSINIHTGQATSSPAVGTVGNINLYTSNTFNNSGYVNIQNSLRFKNSGYLIDDFYIQKNSPAITFINTGSGSGNTELRDTNSQFQIISTSGASPKNIYIATSGYNTIEMNTTGQSGFGDWRDGQYTKLTANEWLYDRGLIFTADWNTWINKDGSYNRFVINDPNETDIIAPQVWLMPDLTNQYYGIGIQSGWVGAWGGPEGSSAFWLNSSGGIEIETGSDATQTQGPDISITAADGFSGSAQRGGNIIIQAGMGGSTNGTGGNLELYYGTADGIGQDGYFLIYPTTGNNWWLYTDDTYFGMGERLKADPAKEFLIEFYDPTGLDIYTNNSSMTGIPRSGANISLHSAPGQDSGNGGTIEIYAGASHDGPIYGYTASFDYTTDTITGGAGGFNTPNNTKIKFNATGTLPSGLDANTLYYIVNSTYTTPPYTFQVSLSQGGSPVSLIDNGTGTTYYYLTGGTAGDIYIYTEYAGNAILGDIYIQSARDFYQEASNNLTLKDGNLTYGIPISESGVSGLVGFTATSIVGALNELNTGEPGESPWIRIGTTIKQLTASDNLELWNSAVTPLKVFGVDGITGDTYIAGKLTVDGAIDPTELLMGDNHPIYLDENKANSLNFSSTLHKMSVNSALITQIPIIHNKLGSLYELEHPVIGSVIPTITGAIGYESSYFDNGFIANAGGSYLDYGISFQNALKDRGTIEFWFTPKYSNPIPFVAGYFVMAGGDIQAWWGDGVSGIGGLAMNLGFTSGGAWTTCQEATPWVATPYQNYHLAFVWDRDGIDGSADTHRIYRDGVIVATSSEVWGTDDAIYSCTSGNGADGQHDRYIIDNWKIYDVAKVDFSDRFYEYSRLSGDIEINAGNKVNVLSDIAFQKRIIGYVNDPTHIDFSDYEPYFSITNTFTHNSEYRTTIQSAGNGNYAPSKLVLSNDNGYPIPGGNSSITLGNWGGIVSQAEQLTFTPNDGNAFFNVSGGGVYAEAYGLDSSATPQPIYTNIMIEPDMMTIYGSGNNDGHLLMQNGNILLNDNKMYADVSKTSWIGYEGYLKAFSSLGVMVIANDTGPRYCEIDAYPSMLDLYYYGIDSSYSELYFDDAGWHAINQGYNTDATPLLVTTNFDITYSGARIDNDLSLIDNKKLYFDTGKTKSYLWHNGSDLIVDGTGNLNLKSGKMLCFKDGSTNAAIYYDTTYEYLWIDNYGDGSIASCAISTPRTQIDTGNYVDGSITTSYINNFANHYNGATQHQACLLINPQMVALGKSSGALPSFSNYSDEVHIFSRGLTSDATPVTAMSEITLSPNGITANNDIEITDNTKGIILKSPNGTRYRVTVADNGTLITTAI